MARKDDGFRKAAAENMGKAFKVFGDALSEALEDPELREKAKRFSQDVMDSAVRIAARKIEDEELRTKIKRVSKAAEYLGKTVAEHIEPEKVR